MPEYTFSATQRRRLVRLLRAAYPHAQVPDGPYERTADAVIAKALESTFDSLSLSSGLDSLDQSAGGDFGALDDEAGEQVLRGIESAAFFRMIRSVAVVSLYDDHEVWDVLGYEGPSFELGGYVHRGFDDLDWLPSPRVTEYDGPEELVEVAPDDQPRSAGGQP